LNEKEKSNRGLKGYEFQRIDAAKNARLHSNMGNIYYEEKNYLAALKEYELAYNLGCNTTNASVYLYNIARCFINLGNYKLAQNAIKGAIEKDCINMLYYETLVDCYINLNTTETELQKHLNDNKNPYNRIIAGLIFLKTGQKTNAKIIFDEFIINNPDMIITSDVKRLIQKL